MAEYAIVVSSNTKFLFGLNALLNSLEYSTNNIPVHVLTTDIDKNYQKATSALNYSVIWHQFSEEELRTFDNEQLLLRKRFELPVKLDVDAVCVLDADMLVLDDLHPYLEIASKTNYILGCGQEQKKQYNDKEHMFEGKYLINPNFTNEKDICSSPLFCGRCWYETLKLSANRYFNQQWLANDMDALNIVLMENEADKWILPLPQHVWTGLHESMLKLHSRAVESFDKLYTEDGQKIIIVHGRYWEPEWIHYQMWNQKKMIDNIFGGNSIYNKLSATSMQTLVVWWNKMNDYKLKLE